MNCTYYIVFEQNYKKILWWKNKKERIQKQIETNDTKQMEVRKHWSRNINNSMAHTVWAIKSEQLIVIIEFQLDRKLMEAVGNAHPYNRKQRNPDPKLVDELLKAGAQPDFVMPWLPSNKRRR